MSKEKGNLYPSIIWLDFRADAIAEEMNDQIAEATGDPEYRPFSGKDGIPKILWLKSHRPDLWDAMDCFIGDTGYMVYRATGELVCSCQCALCIALDIETRYWDLDLLGNFGIEEEKLPKIMQAVDIAGVLTETAAAELGLPPGLPVTAGFSDCTAIDALYRHIHAVRRHYGREPSQRCDGLHLLFVKSGAQYVSDDQRYQRRLHRLGR
jgi:xylulokinase